MWKEVFPCRAQRRSLPTSTSIQFAPVLRFQSLPTSLSVSLSLACLCPPFSLSENSLPYRTRASSWAQSSASAARRRPPGGAATPGRLSAPSRWAGAWSSLPPESCRRRRPRRRAALLPLREPCSGIPLRGAARVTPFSRKREGEARSSQLVLLLLRE